MTLTAHQSAALRYIKAALAKKRAGYNPEAWEVYGLNTVSANVREIGESTAIALSALGLVTVEQWTETGRGTARRPMGHGGRLQTRRFTNVRLTDVGAATK